MPLTSWLSRQQGGGEDTELEVQRVDLEYEEDIDNMASLMKRLQ